MNNESILLLVLEMGLTNGFVESVGMNNESTFSRRRSEVVGCYEESVKYFYCK